MDESENKYRSRKFLITVGCVAIGCVFAYMSKLDSNLSNLLLAAMASYNIANAWATGR